ncbi:MAG: DUF3604 domain-containing protein [bacterium]|nr:DUF3604 domain-containing protein [bacterium]
MPGFTTVRASRAGVRLLTGMEHWNAVWGSLYLPGLARPEVTVTGGTLVEGDTITFTLGDRGGGGPGLLMNSSEIDALPIRFELSPTGDGLVYLILGEPKLAVRGSVAHQIRVVAPTTVRSGESFTIRAAVEDRYFNRASDPPERLELWLDSQKIAEARGQPGNEAVFHFRNVRLPENLDGAAYYEATGESGRLRGRSNPVVRIGAGEPHVWWGELHGHEAYTDGSGTAEWYMRYARDIGFLDFASLSAHDIMISELHLRDVARVTRKYNEPGRFITLRGYEWTQDARYGGHHNVYYRDEASRLVPSHEARTIADLYRRQREINDPDSVLIIPHCHQPGDWNFNDALLERLVEIYSQHGSFEWFGRRYLEQGYHVGLIAGGDDHTEHPGNASGRRNNRTGRAAVLADELTRDGIFDGLKNRRAYGTTLRRIYLDTRVEAAPMGSERSVAPRETPSLHVEGVVAGTAPITRVVAVSNGRESGVLDYTRMEPSGASTLLRVMIGSSSEPADQRQVLPPLATEHWMGRVTVRGARIDELTELSIEGIGESFVRTGASRVDFFAATRGDQDGALLRLDGWPADGAVTVEVYEPVGVDLDSRGLLSTDNPLWGGGSLRPDKRLVKRIRIPLADLDRGEQRREFGERSWIAAARIPAELPSYRRFSFELTDHVDPKGENYVYIRAEQVDDEMAWSSPVWLTWQSPGSTVALALVPGIFGVLLAGRLWQGRRRTRRRRANG